MRDSAGQQGPEQIEPLVAQPLADRIYNVLRENILALALPPGSQLVERELSTRFGVSKSPVRDALQRLAGEGLVTYTAHRGITVREMTPKEAHEIQQVRAALEELAVGLATPRLTDADINGLKRILGRARDAIEANDQTQLTFTNREFHELFAQCSGNQLLQQMLGNLRDRIRIVARLGWQEHPLGPEESYAQHEALLEAAQQRNVRRATELIRTHILSRR